MKYSAKEDYKSYETAENYERRKMYRGILGKLRSRIESKVITEIAESIHPNSIILDCPCGNGRWFETLSTNARKIVGLDVSPGMLNYAESRRASLKTEIQLLSGDATELALDSKSVDYTFSYALMKHLPVPLQYKVLGEFARVSRKGIFCSFAVLNPFSYSYWLWKRPPESFPVIRQELAMMARQAGLKVNQVIRISQPIIGLEFMIEFQFSHDIKEK